MALGRHLVAAHIRSVGWAVPLLFAGSPTILSGQGHDPVSLIIRSDDLIIRSDDRPTHFVSRADRQARPPGHAKTRRMRTPP